jgi:SAM-dependent methyltransferase
MPMREIQLYVDATRDNFDERGYLEVNPDVAVDVRKGVWARGRDHFEAFGAREGRQQALASRIDKSQSDKIARIEPLLNLELSHTRRGVKYDFLTDELRTFGSVIDNDRVGSNNYDGYVLSLINEFETGIILDCGAGSRKIYYPNVVNFDIVDYVATDIIGLGESLPFKTASFDAVISIAVLEHVRDPFRCAAEIVRVLKPGGKLLCCVPFLAPLHGYPNHYYNMTPPGLRALFERQLEIEDQQVIDSILPIWSLTWIVSSWASGLEGKAREEFLSTPLRALLANPEDLLKAQWVTSLSREKNFELAAGSMIFARKPSNS